MQQHRTNPGARCPACYEHLTGATGVPDIAPPRPGDLSVCIGCGVVLEFNTDLRLFLGDLDELPKTARDSIVQAQQMVDRFSRTRGV